jgi:hypothetical protein
LVVVLPSANTIAHYFVVAYYFHEALFKPIVISFPYYFQEALFKPIAFINAYYFFQSYSCPRGRVQLCWRRLLPGRE